MCGIVGYTGPKEAYPIIIKGLKRLEYRGYDSAGVALNNSSGLKVYKKKGKWLNWKTVCWEKICIQMLASVIHDGLRMVSQVTAMHIHIHRRVENLP